MTIVIGSVFPLGSMGSPGRNERKRTSRRRLLVVAAAVGLSGCSERVLGSGDSSVEPTGTPTATPAPRTTRTPTAADEATPTDGSPPTDTPEATPEETPTSQSGVEPKEQPSRYSVGIDHPAVRGLGREPTIGDHPDETSSLIVEFQDVSCEVCASFDARTFPRLYANLIQPGKATFVSRDFPHVEEWTHPATHALEATYARDHDAYWELKSRYYAYQHEYTMDNIYPRTRRWLADHTTLDADAVLRDVRGEAYASAVERDMSVKRAADVNATPTFFLFRDGEYRTRLTGNQDYTVFENALGY